MSKKQLTALATGLAFLLPNIIGFCVFTLFPLIASLGMAFTNWDLRLHNQFNRGSVHFVGFENFHRLLVHPDFWLYFGNTLFLMLIIPFSIAGSLGAAMLLSRRPARKPSRWPLVLAGFGLGLGCFLLLVAGAAGTAFGLLIGGLASFLFLGGVAGGSNFYRTIYYLPNFTAGIATYLLWKKMYDPHAGPVNAMLQPFLETFSHLTNRLPASFGFVIEIGFRLLACVFLVWGLVWIRKNWRLETSEYHPHRWEQGVHAFWRLFFVVLGVALLWALGGVTPDCFTAARAGLNAPSWLTDYHWAKPAIMIMGFWASLGSNNMLLYLAGLSNVPEELKEAASIDGATAVQRFCHVTWPQLAPITFFIVIMSVIGGLQGGFEMARALTNGGPGGATTTLSYFVYTEGFTTGRLGYASAIAWMLFLLVFIVTLCNWKIGSRFTND